MVANDSGRGGSRRIENLPVVQLAPEGERRYLLTSVYVWRRGDLTLAEKAVHMILVALADRCTEEPIEVSPSVGWIAGQLSLAERTVQRSLRRLVKLSLIVERYRGPKRPRAYRLLPFVGDVAARIREEELAVAGRQVSFAEALQVDGDGDKQPGLVERQIVTPGRQKITPGGRQIVTQTIQGNNPARDNPVASQQSADTAPAGDGRAGSPERLSDVLRRVAAGLDLDVTAIQAWRESQEGT